MAQLKTSLRFVDLPDVVALLASFGCTGRLQLTLEPWTGALLFRRGQIVAASLGAETGQAALEGIALGILDGELTYDDAPVSDDLAPLVDQGRRARYLGDLDAEGRRLLRLVPSLRLVPHLIGAPDSRVTIGASALQMIPLVDAGGTLDQIAQRHGLARTVRGVARLVEAGLVKLDLSPVQRVAPVRPAARPVAGQVQPARGARPAEAPHPAPAAPTPGVRGAVLRFFGFDEPLHAPPPRLDVVA